MIHRLSVLAPAAAGAGLTPFGCYQETSLAARGYRAKPDIHECFVFEASDRRETMGLTQEEFAERAGIYRTNLSDIERGMRKVSLLYIQQQ